MDYLSALGITLAFLLGVVSLLAAREANETEPEDVRAYRREVQAACRALILNDQSVDFVALADVTTSSIDKQRLVDALNRQADTSIAILDNLWSKTVPVQLASAVDTAHRSSAIVVFVSRAFLGELVSELPDPVPLELAFEYQNVFGAENGARLTDFEAAMSELAGDDCRPIPPS
jgi:hypothetical protein